MKSITVGDYKVWVEPNQVRVHSVDCDQTCDYGDLFTLTHNQARKRIQALLNGTARRVSAYKVIYGERIQIGCSSMTRTQLQSVLKQIESCKS